MGEFEILLDQQDRHVAALAQEGDGAADVLDHRGLDAFGRLVEYQQLGPHGERPADGELLLLATGEIATAALQHRIEHREEFEHLVGNLALVATDRREACLEVLLHRKQREDLAALRHQRHATPRPLVGRQLGDFLVLEGDRARGDRLQADDGAQQAGLADAVATQQAGHPADRGRHRHRAQRLGGTVEEIDVLDGEHCYRPR